MEFVLSDNNPSNISRSLNKMWSPQVKKMELLESQPVGATAAGPDVARVSSFPGAIPKVSGGKNNTGLAEIPAAVNTKQVDLEGQRFHAKVAASSWTSLRTITPKWTTWRMTSWSRTAGGSPTTPAWTSGPTHQAL